MITHIDLQSWSVSVEGMGKAKTGIHIGCFPNEKQR
jgi:hypothetical protein